MYGSEYKEGSKSKAKEKESELYPDKSKEDITFIPFMENPKEDKKRLFTPTNSPNNIKERSPFVPFMDTPKDANHRNFTPNPTPNSEIKQRAFKPSLNIPVKKRIFVPDPNLNHKKNFDIKQDEEIIERKQEKTVHDKYPAAKVNLKEKNMLIPQTSNEVENFLHYTHNNELINDLVHEFSKSGNWLKNLRPTQTFINYLREKQAQFKNSSLSKEQEKAIGEYITLTTKIKNDDALSTSIRNLILQNKGKYNAYDIQNWTLISDTSARNLLKRMFPNEKYQDYVRTQEYVSIKTIEDIAKQKGGICHTKNIKNAKSKIQLECAEGHQFDTSYDSVVYQNTWCPDCNIYVSETVCRNFFVRIFESPFPKSYPEWLTNEKGNQLELDGYNKNLKLAFEYQGIQHRQKAFNKTEDDVKALQKEDALKLKLCKENGVTLIQVPDDKIVPYNKMQNFIEKECKQKTGIPLQNIPKFDYKDFPIYENKHAKKFRAYVEEKGGTLMTPYFTAKKKVVLMCEKGHQWTTTPDSVYKNNWCSVCAGNKKGTTESFRNIGDKFGCKLISEYINAKELLLYKCQKGHKFKKSPYWLKKDYKKIKILCPACKMEMYAEKFHNYVNKRKGGEILTSYRGRFKSIKIKCKNNHVWNTTPGAVYQGRWCNICRKKKKH